MITTGHNGYDAIILGAGGAGLMAAARAGQRGRRVLVIDHSDAVGKKILISGGGRCNFTNVNATPGFAQARFLSHNPHFAKSALGRFTPQDFLALVKAHHIAFHEKTLGQLFCDGSARQIVAMLLTECERAASSGGAVEFALSAPIRDISHADGQFRVSAAARTATAPSLIIATGGPSIPKMGASGFAYELARQFGLKVIEPRPALVPLTLGNEQALFRELSGISADVTARCANRLAARDRKAPAQAEFREAALLTHRGLSGPAILQVSSYWQHGDPVVIDFAPDAPAGWLCAAKRAAPRASVKALLADWVSERLAALLAEQLALPGNLADQSDAALAAAEARIRGWTFHPNGSEGYAKAEVTAGGISTEGLSQQTLAARHLPRLYAIGEAVDVTGWLGGYNFQWAWASAVAAGEAV